MEENIQTDRESLPEKPYRPFLLTIICLFSFVFFGLISLLFLLAVFSSGWITEIVNKYAPENMWSKAGMTVFLLSGFITHAASLAGSVMIWLMKRKGYLVFSISVLIIAAYQLSQAKISFVTTVVYILLIILFGFFYKRMR